MPPQTEFPERIYTVKEWMEARKSISEGHKHRLRIKGSREFKEKTREALRFIKATGYYDFLRTYIRQIVEINGLSQLRESEAAVWLNSYCVKDAVDAASFIIQKAWQMKEYLDGKLYYDGNAELRAVEKRVEFLNKLKNKTREEKVRQRCEELLKQWSESIYL